MGILDNTNFGGKIAKKLADWKQRYYPLECLQDMLTQLRGIQESVQAEGMKEEERVDWNGVKMQLFRIFQQEQFIFKFENFGKLSEKHSAVNYHVGTRTCQACNNKTPRRKRKCRACSGTGIMNTLLKRFLFTLDSGTITKKMKDAVAEKAHCAMYLHEGSKIQGFMHLIEYTELNEFTKDILGINTTRTYFE